MSIEKGQARLVVGIADTCFKDDLLGMGSAYSDAVYAAGALPLVLPATANPAVMSALLDRVDMVLFCGGKDVDPSRYGAVPRDDVNVVDPKRDAWEFALLAEVTRRRLPVLGICRGCQLINVFFGGDLWQDLPSEFEGGPVHSIKDEGLHPVSTVEGSYIASLLGATASVNSTHHQAVKHPAPGFKVTARSPEGVIEAIEGVDYPAVCVQFHPERLVRNGLDMECLSLFRGGFASFEKGRKSERAPGAMKLVAVPDHCPTSGQAAMRPALAEALEKAGFAPYLVPFTADDGALEEAMSFADALMVGGGIGPLQDYDKRTGFEHRAIGFAVKRGIPVAGICHGMQVINTFFGGRLERTPQKAEATDFLIAHRRPAAKPPMDPGNFHTIDIVRGSRCAAALGVEKIIVNSSHSLHCAEMGKGLRITARASDGIVEAFEHESLSVTAFQFHPERLVFDPRFVELLRVALAK